ncbi:MAG: S8 family serine peptidase [Calditrichaeota bacterium]|nr:S8 family serine peptidase [Calditrichota bacterium]
MRSSGTRIFFVVCILIAVSLNAFAALKPRWTPPKPKHTTIGSTDQRECITVKFIEGSQVRLRDGHLISLIGTDLTDFKSIIARSKVKNISRLFTRPEHLLEAERQSGQERSGKQLADLNLYYRIIIDPTEPAEEFIDALNSLNIIEGAHANPSPVPAEDIPPDTPEYHDEQGYLYEAPEGVNAPAVWEIEGGRGEDIKIIDIEGGWHFGHEDLKEEFFLELEQENWADHGDAVIGIMVGQHNEYGINGICPEAQIGGYSIVTVWPNVANAFNETAAALDEGDVFLIELHNTFGGRLSPMETWQENFDAIETASANGVICVEAAGNGNSNLDDDGRYEGRFDPENRHSGAILVGAGAPPSGNFGPDRCRLDFSNYGERVDLQGWGREVTTTGYGDLFFPGNDRLQWYTSEFSGTSSATPIVAGSVVCIQGIYKARTGGQQTLTSTEIRDILHQSGTPQNVDGLQGNIGPRPNLSEAVNLLSIPGTLSGIVTFAGTDEPIQDATVSTNYGYVVHTNPDGLWRMEGARSGMNFNIIASKVGFNDSTIVDVFLEEEGELEFSFGLNHPEFAISENRIEAEINPSETETFEISLSNQGNGPLHWNTERRFMQGNGGFGRMVETHILAPEVNDLNLQGVAFVDGFFYVSGENGQEPNLIYVFDIEGNYVTQFNQTGRSRVGMLDLAYDGELLWGSGEQVIYGFTTEGAPVVAFDGPTINNMGLAYDPDLDLLWVKGNTADIIGYDREGNQITAFDVDIMRISGLAYWPDDPDGYNLYILYDDRSDSPPLSKMNTETGEIVNAAILSSERIGAPKGAFITTEFLNYGTTFICLIDDYLNRLGDRVDVWQMGTYKGWMTLEPASGSVDPGSDDRVTLTLNSASLFPSVYDGEIVFRHNAIDSVSILSVTVEVNDLEITTREEVKVPFEFGISSVYPNPFNSSTTVKYYLEKSSDFRLSIVDITGREIRLLSEDYAISGMYTRTLGASDMPSGVFFVRLISLGKSDVVKIVNLE